MRCIKLEAAVLLSLCIVLKPRMVIGEIIKLHNICRNSVIQGCLSSFRCKLEMTIIVLFIILAIALALDSCLKMGEISVSIVRCYTVCAAIVSISKCKSVQIVDQVLVQILKCIYSLSIMRIDGIILICIEQEVITAASHRTDPWNIVIVLDDRHETGDASLYRCFINNSCVLSSALWSAIGIVAKHNCDGTSVANADRYILSGKITLHGICPGFLCLYRYCGSCKCAGKQHSCEKFKYFFLHVFSSLCIYI